MNSKDMDVPPPSYEDAVRPLPTASSSPAEASNAAAALVYDGESDGTARYTPATSMASEVHYYAMSEGEAEHGFGDVDMEEGRGEGCWGWEASSTRLGVNVAGNFVGLVGEEKEFGIKIGGLTPGITSTN